MLQALEMQLLNTAFALLDQLYTVADARQMKEIDAICASQSVSQSVSFYSIQIKESES